MTLANPYTKPTISKTRNGYYVAALTVRASSRWRSRSYTTVEPAQHALAEAKAAAVIVAYVAGLCSRYEV